MRLFSVTLLILLVVPFLSASSSSVRDDVRPDGWAGMVLDVSSPDDAIRLFGIPAKDKDKVALDLPRPLSWLSDRYKEKVFRTISYKKLRDYEQVQFSFLDGKLVSIVMEAPNGELKDNWIDPDDLEQLLGASFRPHKRKRNNKLPSPSTFIADSPAELQKDEYDYFYDMIAVSEKSFIVAVVDNHIYISGLFKSPDAKRRDKINARGPKYPGYVDDVEIVSRTLASP